MFSFALAAGLGANWIRDDSPSEPAITGHSHPTSDHDPMDVEQGPVNPVVGVQHGHPSTAPRLAVPPVELARTAGGEFAGAAANAAANALALGDTFLEEGSPAAALRQFEELRASDAGWFQDQLHFRCGLCAEALGDLDQALDEYRSAVRTSENVPLSNQARLGQARIWSRMGRFGIAEAVLAEMLLTSGPASPQQVRTRSEITHRLADVIARQTVPKGQDLLGDDALLPAPDPWVLMLSPELLASTRGGEPASPALPEGVTVVNPEVSEPDPSNMGQSSTGQSRPDAIRLRARLSRMPVSEALSRIAAETGVPFQWSPAATLAVSGRTLTLSVEEIGLALLLDASLRPLGLVWQMTDDGVHVTAATEWAPPALAMFTSAVAARLLSHAVETFPDDDLAAASAFLRGNLDGREKRWDAARARYEQVLRQYPRSKVVAAASFNLAKTHLIQNRFVESREAFFQSIDAGQGHESEAVSYLFIGRSFLEAGEPRRATTPLARALTLGRDGRIPEIATLSLCSAYLMSGNPQGANRLLMERRQTLSNESDHDLTAFLAALARFRAALDDNAREREARAVVIASTHVQPEQFFGRYGRILIGQALRDVGLADRMADLYTEGLVDPALFPLRDQMALDLADARLAGGQREIAARLYESLRLQGGPRCSREAMLKFATLRLEDDQYAAAITLAREALSAAATEEHRAAALRLMGKAYQHSGDRAAAALCFAGVDPTATQALAPGSARQNIR